MSHEAFSWAKAQNIKSAPQKLLYLLLAERIDNDSGLCFPGQVLLAEEASMSLSQVKIHLKALENARYIERSKRFRQDGAPTSDAYTFPGFMEWLRDSKQNARELHDALGAGDHSRKPTCGGNPPAVDSHIDHSRVSIVTTAGNPATNLKKNLKKNLKSFAFHGNGEQEIFEPQPEPPLPAKPRAKATKGGLEFEEAWNAYKAASGRSLGSKPKALEKFEGLTAVDRKLVVPAIEKYRASGDPRYMVDMHRFIKDFFRQYAEPANPAEQEETQVKAVALDLQKGEPKYILQWWPNFQAIPRQIVQAAKAFIDQQGWEPVASY